MTDADIPPMEEEAELLEFLPEEILSDTDKMILSHKRFSAIKRDINTTSHPLILLNRDLQILWWNQAFANSLSKGGNPQGKSLFSILSKFPSASSLREISRDILDKTKSYSWKGRVELHDREQLTIIANLLVLPFLKTNKTSSPLAYLGIFDDVTEENRSLLHNTFLSLLEASKLKDNDTGYHIVRVSEYCRLIAGLLYNNPNYPEVDREFIENIGFLAAMHDVGKIGTPDDILNKEGPLDEREWLIMKEHTKNGAFILSTYPNPMAKQIALFHHEKWDGTGYPYQLSETMIPLPARIVSIADVYDALRMERSYKKSFSHQEASEIIIKNRGIHFDPALVDLFIENKDSFNSIFDSLVDDPYPQKKQKN